LGHTKYSPSTTGSEPHAGHFAGISNGGADSGRFSRTTVTTLGITSPARSITTVSPTRTSSSRANLGLWSVAWEIVTPASATGTRTARGVRRPVRPT
jgi:hypothetical protein